LHAFAHGRNISNQLALEILLYISAQRQIKVAIEEFGVGSGDLVIIILGNSEDTVKYALVECEKILNGVVSDEILDLSNNSKISAIQDYFNLTGLELNAIKSKNTMDSYKNAIVKAVLNRIALVALEK